MLLYLTSNKNRNLIDKAAKETTLAVKKLVGKYVLRSFITKEIRNFTAVRYFVVDSACAEDSIGDFCIALQSFQMMFSAKVVVLLSGNEDKAEYAERLSAAGITNLITEDTPEGIAAKLTDYLTDKPKAEPIIEQPQAQWQAKNIKIAVAGAQRRCGTTVTAMNLAYYLAAQGASVCYVEDNINRHLRMMLKIYEAKAVKEHYTVSGVDFYYSDDLERSYNFVIYDCGALTVLSENFKAANKRLLCGAALPYELPTFQRALSLCGDLPMIKLAVGVPEEMKAYCTEQFGAGLHFAEPSYSLFNEKANESIYSEVIKEYIQK